MTDQEPFEADYDPTKADWLVVDSFFVAGEPTAMPRAKSTSTGGKFTRMYYPNGPWKTWKHSVSLITKQHKPSKPFDAPIALTIILWFPRPAKYRSRTFPAHCIEMPVKPDADNAAKLIMDAMTEQGFWTDDSRVSSLKIEKFYVGDGTYGEHGKIPGAKIIVEVNQNWPYRKMKPTKPTQEKGLAA